VSDPSSGGSDTPAARHLTKKERHQTMRLPTQYPGQNTHRIVLFHPDGGKCDFDRIEDIGADAINAGRTACALIQVLHHEVVRPIYSRVIAIQTHLDKRRVLNADYLNLAAIILRHLEGFADSNPDLVISGEESNRIANAAAQLREAIALSNRVLDLLAAEKDVGWHRGLGR
jgi:hypothetical protein